MSANMTLEEARAWWSQWIVIFIVAMVFYSALYFIAFNKQYRKRNQKAIPIELVHLNEPVADLYTPDNCSRYTKCILSNVNSVICTIVGPTAFIRGRYWEDPLYGTPGLAFYMSGLFVGYLAVDSLAMVVLYFKFQLALKWDAIMHHILFSAVLLWMALPKPEYMWFIGCCAYTMEMSTIFLNANFFAKWYQCSQSVVFKFQCAFLVSWMLVRVPISFGVVPVYLVMFGQQMWKEFPMDKFIGALVLSLGNMVLQSIWTVLIIRKSYRSLTNKQDTDSAVDNYDLKPVKKLKIASIPSQSIRDDELVTAV